MVNVAALDTSGPRQEMEYARDLWREIKRNPVHYFSRQNRAHWAKTMGTHGALMFTFFWGSDLALNVWRNAEDRRTHHLYANRWPLPVGKQALSNHVEDIRERNQSGYFGDPSFLRDLMPFDGDELAAVIIDTDVSGCRVEAFGLARLDSTSPQGEWVYRIDTMKFRVSGANPAAAAVADYIRDIGDWWRSLAGEKLSAGRRRKQVGYESAQAAFWKVLEGLEQAGENRKPSYREVCDHLSSTGIGVGVTRFGELVKEWTASGRNWPPPNPEPDD